MSQATSPEAEQWERRWLVGLTNAAASPRRVGASPAKKNTKKRKTPRGQHLTGESDRRP